jgi:hypothetical protein
LSPVCLSVPMMLSKPPHNMGRHAVEIHAK